MCGANGPKLYDLLREFEPKNNAGRAYLDLKQRNESPYEITFCDARLSTDTNGTLSRQMYDKSEDMGAMGSILNRYNHATTSLSYSTHMATIRNEMGQAYPLSKTIEQYLHSVGLMILRYLNLDHQTTDVKIWTQGVRPYRPYYQSWYPDEQIDRQIQRLVTELDRYIHGKAMGIRARGIKAHDHHEQRLTQGQDLPKLTGFRSQAILNIVHEAVQLALKL